VPKVPQKEMNVLNQHEVARLLKAAEDDRYYALYVVAVTCGLRQGEILGLKWADIDLDKKTMEVQRQLQWKSGGYHFPAPKSKKSRRLVMLPHVTVKALMTHKAKQNERRLSMGQVWEELDLVFATKIGSPIRASNLLRRSFYPLLEKAGLPRIRFHDLRHTAATLLLQQGVHAKIVQDLLGHSQISLTLDTYSHVLPGMKREAAKQMDTLFKKKGKK